jgi:predicted Zn-ribbon and HTH transcriptional regulator
MLGHLRAVLGRGTAEFCECRRCGTTVDAAAVGCPACDSEDIARYEF